MKPHYLTSLALSLLLIWIVPSAADSRSCFVALGLQAPDDIIPCYSSFGAEHYSCCKVGDVCLEHNACYDSGTGVTYQYGCTDENYQDDNCPKKCDLDAEKSNWIGLVYCNGTANTPDKTWLCHHPDNCGKSDGCDRNWDPELQKLSGAYCADMNQDRVAFEGPSTISDLVRLPESTGVSKYFVDHPITSDATTTVSQPASTSAIFSHSGPISSTTASPTQSATANPTQTSAKPLPQSKSHTLAMAIGFGAGIPAILAVTGFFLYHWRRRRNQAKELGETVDSPGKSTNSGEPAYGYKAELPGESRPVSEMPGSPPAPPSEMDGSTIGERTPMMSQTPFVSPVQSEFSGKGREHRMSALHSHTIQELPG